MYLKKTIILLVFLSNILSANAQGKYIDVVYLKNGSIIRGLILELVPNESIKIQTADKSIFVYKMEEVEKIAKEFNNGRQPASTRAEGNTKGLKGLVEFGYGIGIGESKSGRMNLNIIVPYQVSPFISAGVGTGLRYHHERDMLLMPVFVDFRYFILDNHVTPYIGSKLGYSFGLTNNFSGEAGVLFATEAGVSYLISRKNSINFGLGFELQRVYGSSYNAINISCGISF